MDYLYFKEVYYFNNFTNCKRKCKIFDCTKNFKTKNKFVYKIKLTDFEKYDLGNINSIYQPFNNTNNFRVTDIEYAKDPCDALNVVVFITFKDNQSSKKAKKSARSASNIGGLVFNKKALKNVDIEIINFANISLSGDGSQFRYGNFIFPTKNKNKPNIVNGTSLEKCFYQQKTFNEDISKWNVSGVINMESIFQGCYNFNGNISNWNTQNVTNLKKSFYNATSFNKSLKYWNTSNCTNFNSTFSNATSFNNDIRYWYIDYNANVNSMFNNCPSASNFPIPRKHIFTYTLPTAFVTSNDLTNKDSSNQPFRIINNNMNFKIVNLTSVDNGDGTTTINIFFSHNFINRKNQLKSSNVVDTNYHGGLTFNSAIYYENAGTETITINNFGSVPLHNEGGAFKTSYVSGTTTKQGFNYIFTNDNKNMPLILTKGNLNGTFENFYFNSDIDYLDIELIFSLNSTFYEAFQFNQPLNKWNTSNVNFMGNMFIRSALFNQPLNNWDVSNVTDMGNMFSGCSAFNQSLDNWNISNCTNIADMFSNCSVFNQPLNNWDTSNVTLMSNMFKNATLFDQDI